MKSVQFKDVWFNVPDDGIGYDSLHLMITVIAHNEDEKIPDIEDLLNPVPDVINIYDENHEEILITFTEYTKIRVISKEYGERIYDTDEKFDLFNISFEKPSLEEAVARNTEDIIINDSQTFYTAMMTDTLIDL